LRRHASRRDPHRLCDFAHLLRTGVAQEDHHVEPGERDPFIGVADPRNEASLKVLRKLGGVYTHSAKTEEDHLCEWYMYRRPAA